MNARARLIFRNLVGWSAACAFFWIWREVLPALGVLDQISLWDVELKDAEGALHVSPITLANLAMAAVIGTIAVLAARNMPGLLEISLLQRLPMHRGSRYAVNMLVQYVIVAIGITLTLSTLGLRWGQVQWLVAALGVGLGFGLQEIFANFVSGLILLFERPVRVGDFVTIGELSGRVTRIQIRATTICDADNREIIVPNKNFITDRFLNWTLTDAVTRLVIPVGVAYGSNTDQALTLLLDIARAHPNVLHEPAPCAVFQSFGDSALLLELQVYAKEINLRVDLRHELNTRIYRAFAEHGIEIPRPQREVLLRSVPPDSCLK
jgi:potassium efflux system protein